MQDAMEETTFPDERAGAELHLLPQIAALYGELARLTGSPVVELNRAVAVAEAQGPTAGLALVDRLGLDS